MNEQLEKIWYNTVLELKQESQNSAFGWFNKDEKLLKANKSMCNFLGTTEEKLQPAYFLVNPDFKKLSQLTPCKNKLIFEGLLTIGNYADVSFVLNSKIFRDDEIFFIYAEADVIGLFEENKKMSLLNQQVNSLQRQLLKEKTKLEQTLKELRETQQMLIQSEKMNALGQMVAGVAHEINNPLAFVTNNLHELKKYSAEIFEAFSELETIFTSSRNIEANEAVTKLKDNYELDFLQEDIKDVLDESQTGVARVKKIVEDMRKFSRLDESEIKHIDFIENIQSILSIVKTDLAKKEIDFKLISPEKLMADCYPGQLNQAILNILINAIYAVELNGEIKLTIQEQPESVIISVEDNGQGIPEEALDKIFNPFFTTKPVGSGTGLGLSITYKIITDLHKGEIEVESAADTNTHFKITIPKIISD